MLNPDSTEPLPHRHEAADSGPLSSEDVGDAIEDLQREINRLQRSIRQAIQAQLSRFADRNFGSLQQNQQMVQTIHTLLDSHGLRVQCSECGHPAILRVSARPGIEHGAFVFDHTIDRRRTFHGGRAVMPQIRLVSKPARKKAAS
ncbi:hypothetical protein SH528x_007269 [Novipirellula sp. SH528]|uniref:hypothetical protein n=1 Tax=Novipirellula sp. SH528 TaxID=3454466 RepID=UPI003FA04565